MDIGKLKNVLKLRRKVTALRASKNVRNRHLVLLAKASGWIVRKGMGDEPRYEHPRSGVPLTIPNHPGDLAPGTVKSVLLQIDGILFDLEEELREREGKHEKE